jgi:hypothetical protein
VVELLQEHGQPVNHVLLAYSIEYQKKKGSEDRRGQNGGKSDGGMIRGDGGGGEAIDMVVVDEKEWEDAKTAPIGGADGSNANLKKNRKNVASSSASASNNNNLSANNSNNFRMNNSNNLSANNSTTTNNNNSSLHLDLNTRPKKKHKKVAASDAT